MAKLLDSPHHPTEPVDAGLVSGYQKVCEVLHDRRVELINARIVVREVPSIRHGVLVYRLLLQLLSVVTTQGWNYCPEGKNFLGAESDRYVPDILIIPPDAELWDSDNVYGSEALLVVEMVSPGSGHDDHHHKPIGCARGGVPLYLVVDTFEGTVKLFSKPSDKGYQQCTEVKLGQPLKLPEPWDLTIDTGKLIED